MVLLWLHHNDIPVQSHCIETDELFISEENSFDVELGTIEASSAKLSNPLEVKSDDI